jgi:acyl carrier protein
MVWILLVLATIFFVHSSAGAMTKEEITAKVVMVTAEKLNVDEDKVVPEASFVEDLGADQLDCVELIMAFEDEFEMKIPEEEAEKLLKVKDVIEYVLAHQ